MLARAIFAFLALPAMFAGLVPWLVSRIPAHHFHHHWYGLAFTLIGGAVLLACVVSFYRRGRGTLAPWDPPRHLVVHDVYRFTRNPMYLSVVTILVGWALCTGNPWIYVYAAIVSVIFHLRVVFYEELEMQRLFTREWEAYRKAVPRWGFRFRRYNPSEPDDAAISANEKSPMDGYGRQT